MGVIERRTRQKAEIRESILKAARQLAREKDWGAVTIRSIADAIEYTPPIVYEHFENKEDVLLTIVKEGHAENRKALDAVMALELSAEEKLVQLSLTQWTFAHDQPEVFRLMHNSERMAQQRGMAQEEMQEARLKLESLFREVCTNPADVTEVLFNWFCLMQGYINLVVGIQPQEAAEHLEKMKDPNMAALFKDPSQLYERAIRRFIRSL
jgi:AcrR family transcriptional regulator